MHSWHIRDHVLVIGSRPLVMGIVNVTPDSFSDGGRFLQTDAAVAHALDLVRQGADLLDIGGESTRPGSTPVPVDEELRRVLPVVTALVKATPVPLSIDTSKAEVARQCLAAGAHVINDVTALADLDMSDVARQFQAGVILMHMQGTPQTMQQDPRYDNVMDDVARWLDERRRAVIATGVAQDNLVLDPGIGFGKSSAHNLELLVRLLDLQRLGRPICLGVSRKGFIGKITGRSVHDSAAGSVAVACHAVMKQAVQVLRVHDVAATRDAVLMLAALAEAKERLLI
ncbi:MAG: dihydropteroate synthase [Gemmataceae bacterium]|nr:dihydropteroate synthase [Gemmataceae bacterium]